MNGRLFRCARLVVWAVLPMWAGLAGCNAPDAVGKPDAGGSTSVVSASHALLNSDGDKVVTQKDVVLNHYAAVAKDIPAGASDIFLDGSYKGTKDLLAGLKLGDTVLLTQTQGASMDTADASTYGTVRQENLQGAGQYQFLIVEAIAAGSSQVIVDRPIVAKYSASGGTQLIRVPRYTLLQVDAGAGVTAPPWDGLSGGIVAFIADKVVLNGTIDVTGKGFRGGRVAGPAGSVPVGIKDVSGYVFTDPKDGGEKGESIVGGAGKYDTLGGRYGRGAPANGGGGGNFYGSGGGGGANVGNVMGWDGRGVMDPMYQSVWEAEVGMMNLLANSTGGGRGGYTYSSWSGDPISAGPSSPTCDATTWSGNCRRERGGLGGHPLPVTGRLFMGGGGGAGMFGGTQTQQELGESVIRGGNGGGVVLVVAKGVEGSGAVIADGEKGGDTTREVKDSALYGAGGGGGGGGTVVLLAFKDPVVALKARGGKGGNQVLPSGKTGAANGPGGGGAGGAHLLFSLGINMDVDYGKNGTTDTSGFSTPFPPNGATSGASGNVGSFNLAVDPLVARVRLSDKSVQTPGGRFVYYVQIINDGPAVKKDVAISFSVRDAMGGAVSAVVPTTTTFLPYEKADFEVGMDIPPVWNCDDYSFVVTFGARSEKAPLKVNRAAHVSLSVLNPPVYGDNPVAYQITVDNKLPGCAVENDLVVKFPISKLDMVYTGVDGGAAWDCGLEEGEVVCRQKAGVVDLNPIEVRAYAPPDLKEYEVEATVGSGETGPLLGRGTLKVSNIYPAQRVLGGGGFVCQVGSLGGGSFGGTGVFAALVLLTGLAGVLRLLLQRKRDEAHA